MRGIVGYGAYLPYFRLEREAIAAALGTPAGKGARAVASYDEDTTTMGVEAGRRALAGAPSGCAPDLLYFATAAPAYLDKTNACAVHAALGLEGSALAVDMAGAVRSGLGALRAALDASVPALAVLSDIRTGLPGSSDEVNGGDAAAAFLFGTGEHVLAEVIGQASSTEEFLDRWRTPGEAFSRVWEERFGDHAYAPLVGAAWTDALKSAGLTADQVDVTILTGVHRRAVRAAARALGVAPESFADDLSSTVGTSGTAHAGVMLADALDTAEAGKVIAVVVLADGASVLLLRTTEALAEHRSAGPVAAQIAAGKRGLSYEAFLSWRGFLRREPPRRPDPQPPAAPPALRHERWKFGFRSTRCEECGTRHLPPGRVCLQCGAVDRMQDENLADVGAAVVTFTLDRLAYTPSPPLVGAVIDFDGGGRYRCEITDCDPSAIRIGTRLAMTFRCTSVSANGIHNYSWKARPVHEDATTSNGGTA